MGLNSSVVLGLLAVALGIASLLVMPAQIEGHELSTLPAVRSPAFFPTLIAIFLILVGSLLAWRGLIDAVPRGPEQVWPERPANVLLTMAIVLSYTVFIFIIGFYLASAVMVAALAPALGYRNPVGIALAAVGSSLLIYVMFERSLNVFLPGSSGF